MREHSRDRGRLEDILKYAKNVEQIVNGISYEHKRHLRRRLRHPYQHPRIKSRWDETDFKYSRCDITKPPCNICTPRDRGNFI